MVYSSVVVINFLKPKSKDLTNLVFCNLRVNLLFFNLEKKIKYPLLQICINWEAIMP